MNMTAEQDWMSVRRGNTSKALDQAKNAGLTNFTVVGRRKKKVRLHSGKTYTEFISCSYLGLETHPALLAAARKGMTLSGLHLSSSRSAMHPLYLPQLEELMAEIYKGSQVAVFTSTSSVHLGVLPLLGSGSLPSYPIRNRVHWLVDKNAHGSMQVLRGILEQFGPVSRIEAIDSAALEKVLFACTSANETPILLIDGIGSMNAVVPVAELSRALAQASGYLYVDDAHGISISGRHGAGYAFAAVDHALTPNLILAGSLSKGFGGSGGFVVVASTKDVHTIHALANPLVFGHSIMLAMLAANVASAQLHLDGTVEDLQAELWANTVLFDKLTAHGATNSGLRSPVRGVPFEIESEALQAAQTLKENGVLAFPVFYPIVPKGKAMLRFALSALHEKDEIHRLCHVLNALNGLPQRAGPA